MGNSLGGLLQSLAVVGVSVVQAPGQITYTLTWEERTVDRCECVHITSLVWDAVCALEEQGGERGLSPRRLDLSCCTAE